MGEKSKPAGFNLAWGKSAMGKVEKCDSCKKEANKLQYVAGEKRWVCSECAGRPMLTKPSMFGNLRAIGGKEHDIQHDFVQKTKFES